MTTLAQINDRFRRTGIGGHVFVAGKLSQASPEIQARALERTRNFDSFTEDNDPYDEHDFGNFDLEGETVFWKIDYYDKTLEMGSPDPTDPLVTSRVLTIYYADDH